MAGSQSLRAGAPDSGGAAPYTRIAALCVHRLAVTDDGECILGDDTFDHTPYRETSGPKSD